MDLKAVRSPIKIGKCLHRPLFPYAILQGHVLLHGEDHAYNTALHPH